MSPLVCVPTFASHSVFGLEGGDVNPLQERKSRQHIRFQMGVVFFSYRIRRVFVYLVWRGWRVLSPLACNERNRKTTLRRSSFHVHAHGSVDAATNSARHYLLCVLARGCSRRPIAVQGKHDPAKEEKKSAGTTARDWCVFFFFFYRPVGAQTLHTERTTGYSSPDPKGEKKRK